MLPKTKVFFVRPNHSQKAKMRYDIFIFWNFGLDFDKVAGNCSIIRPTPFKRHLDNSAVHENKCPFYGIVTCPAKLKFKSCKICKISCPCKPNPTKLHLLVVATSKTRFLESQKFDQRRPYRVFFSPHQTTHVYSGFQTVMA